MKSASGFYKMHHCNAGKRRHRESRMNNEEQG
jgi:hypothetical protein